MLSLYRLSIDTGAIHFCRESGGCDPGGKWRCGNQRERFCARKCTDTYSSIVMSKDEMIQSHTLAHHSSVVMSRADITKSSVAPEKQASVCVCVCMCVLKTKHTTQLQYLKLGFHPKYLELLLQKLKGSFSLHLSMFPLRS